MYASYIRVSTKSQDLGLDAQRKMCEKYNPVIEFQEKESGRNNSRPILAEAVRYCRENGAILVVAKLDRLGRNAWYMLKLIEESGIDFVFCDNPSATKLTIGILAVIADDEARRISDRTKAALAVLKERGVKLGGTMNPSEKDRELAVIAVREKAEKNENNVRARAIISSIKGTLEEKANYLNAHGFKTSRGGYFSPTQIRRLT